MIALLCGIFIRLNVGAWGIIIISVLYDKHHSDE